MDLKIHLVNLENVELNMPLVTLEDDLETEFDNVLLDLKAFENENVFAESFELKLYDVITRHRAAQYWALAQLDLLTSNLLDCQKPEEMTRYFPVMQRIQKAREKSFKLDDKIHHIYQERRKGDE